MSQFGKASTRKFRPSYINAIIGVALVLFILGILGWIVINANGLEKYFKESVEMQVFLHENASEKDKTALQNYIGSQPYTRSYKYKDKETAKAEWLKSGGENFTEFLDNNILPTSVDFTLKSEFVKSDTLAGIKSQIEKMPGVSEVKFPNAVVDKLNGNVRKISLILLGIALLLAFVVIILIDNTIRLAMFSNRFLIKTMQMVGATRWFIAKPMNIRAIINGAIAGLVAVAGVYVLVVFLENWVPDLKALHNTQQLILLFVLMVFLGIGISLVSTYRSVVKYLKMKLDELY
jgi:cell division transport system permease protein